MSIAGKSAASFVGQIYNLAIGLLSAIVIARLLGPEGKGVVAVVGATTSMAVGLASLGLPSAFGFLAGKGRYSRTELMWSMALWSLLLGGVVALSVWLLRDFLLGSIMKGLTPTEVAVLLVSLPSAFFAGFMNQAYIGYGRVVVISVIYAVISTVGLAGVIVSSLMFHAGTEGAVVALSAATVVGSLLFVATYGRVGAFSLSRFRIISRELVPFGLKVQVGSATQMFSLRADVFFLNYFAGPAAVGIYSVATSLADKLPLLTDPVGRAAYSEIAGAEKSDAARLATTTARAITAIGGVAALGIFAVSVPLIPIVYGRAFADATLYLALLLPGAVAIAVSGAYYVYYVAQLGKPAPTSAIAIVSAVVSALLYSILIPRFGALGAAIGSTISYSTTLVGYGILFPRDAGTSVRNMYLPKREDWHLYWSIFRRVIARLSRASNRG